MAKLISTGQIIDQTWENYTDNFKTWMKISSLLFIVSAIWILGFLLSPSSNTNFLIEQGLISPIQTFGLTLSAIASSILYIVFSFWTVVLFIKTMDDLTAKKKVNIKEVIIFGIKKIIPSIVIAILYIIIMASSLLALAPGFLLIALNTNTGGGAILGSLSLLVFFIGNIAAIIILIVLGVFFAFSLFELLAGKKSIINALKGSYQLVKGRFWSTLLRWVAPKILITAATLFFNIALIVIFVLLFGRIRETQIFLIQVSEIISHISLTGVIVLTAPLWVIADFFLYDSLRKTK